MNIQIRYYTRSGNTKKLADAIGKALDVEVKDVSVPLADEADLLFLGCSYYAFDVSDEIKSFVAANKDKIGKIVCFGTSAMMKSVYKPMKKVVEAAGLEMHPEDFHCRGSFGPMHKGRPNSEDLQNAAAFAKGVVGK
ncbi:MAG: flavodoxin [Roseburia sp.]|nr:flavodoxin [Roseburia sp.]MCM1096594.1 flavodoxin [Ruminococcus flavefaciens]